MPWSQWQQTSEHGRTKYLIDPNAKELVEASGSLQINNWSVTYYANELGRFEVTASKKIKKRSSNILVNDTLEIRLETFASIPKFKPLKKQSAVKNEWKYETFIEINDGNDSIVPEFNEYNEIDPYVRMYARSSIIKAYDFLKQYLPEFEDLIKDKKVAEHASKIVDKAEKL